MKMPFSRPRIEDLDKYLAAKDYKRALAAVMAELEKSPEKFNLLLRQAEILGVAGDPQEAVKVYRKLAARYAKDGFYAKAIALYKKVVKLDPSLDEVHRELAQLIEEDRKTRAPFEQRIQPAAAPTEPQPVTSGQVEQQAVTSRQAEPQPETSRRIEQQHKELHASSLFASFENEALEQILSSTSLRSYSQGEVIVREGDQGSSLFLIVSGTVSVLTSESGSPLPLAELGPGDFFGEVSLLTGKPRTATITAKDAVTAIELDARSVDEIAAQHPEVRTVLEEFYNRRAQETVEAVIRRMREER
jgi:cAMP-dependent protein kinase regulator